MNTPKAFFGLVNPLNLKDSDPFLECADLPALLAAQKSFSKRV